MKKMVIIDSNSLLNRAFYALPPMNTSYGQPTNAVYGFTLMLFKIFEEISPDYIIAAFDKSRKNFRHEKYSDYKAGRKKMPDELAQQFEPVKELLRAFNIGILEVEGYEADDIIGTISKKYAGSDLKIFIVTGDRDTLQLVNDNVNVLLTKKGVTEIEKYDLNYIRDKFGINPIQIIDLKALMGDSSDNIPGVPGIGEKTALKLLRQYKDLDNIYSNLESINPIRIRELLRENKEIAYLSRQLATINLEVPVDINLDDVKIKNCDKNKVRDIFIKLEFNSLLSKVSYEDKEKDINLKKIDAIEDINKIKESIALNSKFNFCFVQDKKSILGMTIENGIFIPENLIKEFYDIFSNNEIEKNTYSSKIVYNYLKERDIQLKNVNFDAEIAAYVLNPSLNNYSMMNLINKYLGQQLSFDDVIKQACYFINHLDVIKEKMLKEMEELDLISLYFKVELPLVEVLSDMEIAGFKVDKETLHSIGFQLSEEIDRLTSEIYDLAGEEFNINSPKQLGTILFEKLKLPVVKKTKTGYSTDAEVLEELSSYHVIVEKVIQYRQLTKLKTTYIDGLKDAISNDGKIHSNFNQTVTATGRISSTEPNLQNIPIKLEQGRQIRKAFVPSNENCLILTADYSQIELRILAHLSKDENLIDAFLKGQDIHARTASEIFKVPIEEVTPLQRSRAKTVNFGIVYGLSDYGLAKDLKISKKEAKEYIDKYFERYKGVKEYLEKTIQFAKEKGYVKTILNRIRYIPEIRSSNRTLKMLGERLAMNTPVQGSAADVIKVAMIKVYNKLKEQNLKSKIILQVHDELVLEVYKDELEIVKMIVKTEMENAIKLLVPLVVDINYGENWYLAK
ncbi:DNA polymerase I [Caloramator fervidus]|uniref:DNA polymerase I n=2 Tax=Caloramator fervidus TaxID=29344 RepID=A0A1H5VSQ5_9CLOT|nr:DNA polymerase I [Caloramator fervidus]